HAVPDRLDARGRGHRPYSRGCRRRAERAAAGRAVRDHGAGIAVRAGRHGAVPGAERTEAFPGRLSRTGKVRRARRNMYAIDYEDFGTPQPVNGAGTVTVEVDGHAVTVPEGTSVMRAAALAGIKVPKLCATDTLKAFGSCRLCLVEIEGRKGYPASCTTTVAAGMKIRTQSDKLLQLRRGVIDLYVSDHPLECASCPAQGHCELEDMAAAVGITGSSQCPRAGRSEEHTSELQSPAHFVCRLLLVKKTEGAIEFAI